LQSIASDCNHSAIDCNQCLHTGDVKSGSRPCNDTYYTRFENLANFLLLGPFPTCDLSHRASFRQISRRAFFVTLLQYRRKKVFSRYSLSRVNKNQLFDHGLLVSPKQLSFALVAGCYPRCRVECRGSQLFHSSFCWIAVRECLRSRRPRIHLWMGERRILKRWW